MSKSERSGSALPDRSVLGTHSRTVANPTRPRARYEQAANLPLIASTFPDQRGQGAFDRSKLRDPFAHDRQLTPARRARAPMVHRSTILTPYSTTVLKLRHRQISRPAFVPLDQSCPSTFRRLTPHFGTAVGCPRSRMREAIIVCKPAFQRAASRIKRHAERLEHRGE